MGHILEIYDNGNCNGFPFATMKFEGRKCEFYPNGNCNGMPIWSMIKTDRCTEVYRQPGMNGFPFNYFKYVPPGRWGGAHGAVEFYPNGNGNGIPEYFFSFRGENAVVFYPTGNANGIPDIAYFEKSGRTVYFYPNGNGNGFPTATIDRVDDIREVIELVFYLFIPHGRRYRPNEQIRTDSGSTVYRSGSGGSGSGSTGNRGGGSGSGSTGNRDNADRGRADSGGGNTRESGGSRIFSSDSGGSERFRALFNSTCSIDSNGRIRIHDTDEDDDDDDDDDDVDARDFTPRRVRSRNDGGGRSSGGRIWLILLIGLILWIIIGILTSK
jgi:hypothetical protein